MRGGDVKEVRPSFLKKGSKKLLLLRRSHLTRTGSTERVTQEKKFFGSFFQKRTFFLPFVRW
jgi:hypothetical protein